MRPSQHSSETHNSDEWISVADLMAGLLMLFALLVIATLVQLKQIEEQNRNKRVLVIQALQEQFNANKISAQINPETGDITLLDSILFVVGKSKLTDDGIKFLEEFIPVYGETLFKDSKLVMKSLGSSLKDILVPKEVSPTICRLVWHGQKVCINL